MRITQYTDFSLRLLLFLASHRDRTVTVREVAEFYGISSEHLKKIVRQLAELGHIRTARGKHGGLTLAREPSAINVGHLVREMENLALLPCFEPGAACPLADCRLSGVMERALAAFLGVLDGQTLADLIPSETQPGRMTQMSA